MPNKSKGGARAGAGRKQVVRGEETISKTVSLSKSQWECARDLGDGNYSAGLRKSLSGYMKRLRRR